ncbi:Hsp33 family molecular chaperone HslO [Desulfopila inferna]|uniref:Hsp33 family molecular chaperone HslO n=1 Tax=Desulfopila inferna TaxID=468528 RepID=UPI00196535B8|nr:Hsp33 family molecular chaperone HslO [Desulfopila inferna]MBM9606357.1 Hsp33 family molecular chaperone HslO [Desulfopila inferna]
MTDTLDRIITASGNIFGLACDTTILVNEARRRHDLGPTAAAALGRALSGAVLLAGLLKDDQNVQVIFEGNGPLGKVSAQAGSSGWCRGYVSSPRADVPLKNGLIDVAGGIGRAGFLRVIKDIGLKEKYTGLVRLYTSEIGEDIAYYLTESEQTPSAISVGVHLQADGTITAAGGYLIQSLPPADEKMLRELDNKIQTHSSVTSLISSGHNPAAILSLLFEGTPHKHTGSTPLAFRCYCSKEKMEDILDTLSNDDIEYLLEQNDGVEVKCDYCNTAYNFPREYLQTLAARKNLH